jgi:hypothetical protein
MRFILIVSLLTLLSCEHARELRMDSEVSNDMMIAAEYSAPKDEQPSPLNAIIKTANYRFQVENVDGSTKNIEAIVKQYSGSVSDMNLITISSEISNTFTIRVPSQNFEVLMNALGVDALYTNFKRISTEDVSEEFIDIESRLKTKKEVRDRYIDILKNKAKTVADVLKAEEQIRILQEEIEAKEGRLRYLQSKVSLSTIHLEIYQRVTFQETPDVFEKPYFVKAQQGFSNGWSIIVGLSLILVNIWPILILGVAVFWRRKWLKKKLFDKD